ncbi:YiiD C-terminal domain-containing protein [Coralloluteibacterium thermophilus]|uniref:YiiD C-terminal domain-containing protein n=1 Tax=Coralloluteibacterium thermophilum TaxID=2707049 RepID=A0ABV9NGF4_9GAMM
MSDTVTTTPQGELDVLRTALRTMPPAVAMGVEPVAYDGHVLRLSAPLALNVNDKGNAFGGSLGSLMTLSAWGLVTLRLHAEGRVGEVYVADSSIRYSAPLYADLRAEARFAPDCDWDAAMAIYARRGRARLTLGACVRDPAGTVVSSLEARFAVLAPVG